MEETPPSPTSLVVSSPRRTLSLLRERRQKHPIPDPDEKTAASAAAAFAEEHGPKPSEVYGFVGCITTVIAAVIFMVWAYTPEPWLHSLGITYYPNEYSRERSTVTSLRGEECPIEPISDIGVDQINNIMFG
ncbi:phosphatidylinositol N-acetylglucosaminyltransferase subunit [Musa troglodytarum]|uniref:Phosphatidylinositol N-acetylglucosaminyltransferase subunit n=1 Tax=Musa troglodytarum TaxID=320322 RepID=A0A9E7FVB3_9LILI|nr:phosphatidylinositol N-acetylglucosaminyltransferase subunit [Musa troglodytarum]